VVEIVKAEAAECPEAAAQLTTPAHVHRIARRRAEAAVLLHFLDDSSPA